jgi:hypothetical protein
VNSKTRVQATFLRSKRQYHKIIYKSRFFALLKTLIYVVCPLWSCNYRYETYTRTMMYERIVTTNFDEDNYFVNVASFVRVLCVCRVIVSSKFIVKRDENSKARLFASFHCIIECFYFNSFKSLDWPFL